MRNQRITIIPIGEVDLFILEFLGECLKRTFALDTDIQPWETNIFQIPDATYKGRCNSTRILMHLSKRIPDNSLRVLAVTEYDLYSPIFSSMFGEAQLGGPCALISLHRLRQEFYDLPPDQTVFLSRCEKEVIHEVAHTFGLLHCSIRECIMYPSTNIVDTDIKSNIFCDDCASRLKIR